MKLVGAGQHKPIAPTTRRSWRAVVVALVWIGAGVVALLTLCRLGPAIVTYTTTAGLHIAVLVPLVSCIIASWDVGGLMLIVLGVRRLITACRSRRDG
jgi:hypothetical protein